jgi:hypothetical protein
VDKMNPNDSQGILRVADGGQIPDDPASNYSVVLTRGGPSGAVDTIAMTKDGVTWTKTLTYTGADLTGVSVWVRS